MSHQHQGPDLFTTILFIICVAGLVIGLLGTAATAVSVKQEAERTVEVIR